MSQFQQQPGLQQPAGSGGAQPGTGLHGGDEQMTQQQYKQHQEQRKGTKQVSQGMHGAQHQMAVS